MVAAGVHAGIAIPLAFIVLASRRCCSSALGCPAGARGAYCSSRLPVGSLLLGVELRRVGGPGAHRRPRAPRHPSCSSRSATGALPCGAYARGPRHRPCGSRPSSRSRSSLGSPRAGPDLVRAPRAAACACPIASGTPRWRRSGSCRRFRRELEVIRQPPTACRGAHGGPRAQSAAAAPRGLGHVIPLLAERHPRTPNASPSPWTPARSAPTPRAPSAYLSALARARHRLRGAVLGRRRRRSSGGASPWASSTRSEPRSSHSGWFLSFGRMECKQPA